MRRSLLVLVLALLAAPPAQGAVFVQDTFTGANGTMLPAHNPDIGAAGSWATMQAADDSHLQSNRVQTVAGGDDARWKNNTVPPSAEYAVQATCVFHTLGQGSDKCRLLARVSNFFDSSFYMFEIQGDGLASLYSTVTGTETTLAQTTRPLVAGTVYRYRLEVRNARKDVYENGVLILTSTNNAITAVGRAGFAMRNASSAVVTTPEMDDFVALTFDPLAAPISGLAATRKSDAVVVSWLLESPGEVLSMQVERESERVGEALFADASLAPGTPFEVADPSPPSDPHYRLIVTRTDGSIEELGPVSPDSKSSGAGCDIAVTPSTPPVACFLMPLLALAWGARRRVRAAVS